MGAGRRGTLLFHGIIIMTSQIKTVIGIHLTSHNHFNLTRSGLDASNNCFCNSSNLC